MVGLKKLNGKQLTTTTNRNKEKIVLDADIRRVNGKKISKGGKIIALHKINISRSQKNFPKKQMPVKKKNFGKTYSTND